MEYKDYFDRFRGMEPYLEVTEEEWSYILETFDREDIQYSLAKVAGDYPIPYREISRLDAIEDFRKLQKLHWKDLVFESDWYAKYEYDFNFSKKCIHRVKRGSLCSDFFHQENRWKVDHARNPSPYRSWKEFEKRRTLMGAAITLKMDHIDKTAFRNMISLRKYICDQFKPSIAKVLYDYFQAETILDFSAGWGDRLAAFYASDYGKKYIGIDPKEDNHFKYKQQENFYMSLLESRNKFFELPEKQSELICSPAEDARLEEYGNQVDLIFTSPPYFDLERYSDEDTQSWVRYGGSSNDWINGFLIPSIQNVWKTLKPGGDLIINISDAYSAGEVHQLCDPMNEYIESLENSEYQGAWGFELVARPQITDRFEEEYVEGKKYCEPAWHWKKQ